MSRLFKFFKNIKARIDKIQQTKHQRSITVISENNISLKWNLSNTIFDKALTIYSIKEQQSTIYGPDHSRPSQQNWRMKKGTERDPSNRP